MFSEPQKGITDFDRFWSAYPRKVAKGAARKTWQKLSPDKDQADKIILAVDAQKRWRKRERDAKHDDKLPDWKHPATWLNGECWDDEIPSASRLHVETGIATEPCQCGEPSVVYNGEGKWCAGCFVDRFTNHRKLHEQMQISVGMQKKNGERTKDYAKRCKEYCLASGFAVPQEVEERTPGLVPVHGEVEDGGPESELPPLNAYF